MDKYVYLIKIKGGGEVYVIAKDIFQAVELAKKRNIDPEIFEDGFRVKMISIAYPGDEIVEN